MKRTILWNVVVGGTLSLGMSVAAVAQMAPGAPPAGGQSQAAPQGAPPQMTMDERMARLTQALNLTPAQAQQIRPILMDAQAKMQALAADNATPMADRQAKAQAIRESVRTQIEAILTPEQKQKAMAPHPQGAPGTGAPPPAQPQSQPQR